MRVFWLTSASAEWVAARDATPAAGTFLDAERVTPDRSPKDPLSPEDSAAGDVRQSPRLLSAVTYVTSLLVGLCAGLSLAAGSHAVAGRTLLEVPVGRAQVFLVVGPLLGLLPAAALCLGAARYGEVPRRAPLALALWAASALVATLWFGLVPLLS